MNQTTEIQGELHFFVRRNYSLQVFKSLFQIFQKEVQFNTDAINHLFFFVLFRNQILF